MIGERRVRREDLRLLRGRGQYVDDIDLPGVVHMAAVRSTIPHARIMSIDTTAAAAAEGVVGVYTAADLEEINRPWPVHLAHASLRAAEQRTLPIEKVRYVGELVAVVVAESRYLAEDACELVEIDYEPLPGSGHLAVSQKLPVAIHDGIDDNVAAHVVQSTGDVDAALARAPRVLRETYSINRGGGHSMEGRAVAARYDRSMGEFIVWDATQTPHQIRAQMAHCYGLPEEKIRVIAPPDVGGGFGPKAGKYPEEIIVPWLAKLLDRPGQVHRGPLRALRVLHPGASAGAPPRGGLRRPGHPAGLEGRVPAGHRRLRELADRAADRGHDRARPLQDPEPAHRVHVDLHQQGALQRGPRRGPPTGCVRDGAGDGSDRGRPRPRPR